MAKIETKFLSEITLGNDLFKSNGYSSVKVTKAGKITELKVPIKSSGITELIEEFKRKEPKAPVISQNVKQESVLGKSLGLNKTTTVKMLDLSDPEYLKAREKYEGDLGIAIVLKGLDVPVKDDKGIVIEDRDKKIDILKQAGMSGEQFAQIVRDIRELTQWTEEERESFFGVNLDTTSDTTV